MLFRERRCCGLQYSDMLSILSSCIFLNELCTRYSQAAMLLCLSMGSTVVSKGRDERFQAEAVVEATDLLLF